MSIRSLCCLTLALLLSACVREAPGRLSAGPTASPSTAPGSPTATPPRPSSTPEPPTPTASPAPLYLDGFLAVAAPDPEALPFVFLIDPYTWQPQENTGCPGCPTPLRFLNQVNPACSFQAGPVFDQAFDSPLEVLLGTRTWQVGSPDAGGRVLYQAAWSGSQPLEILSEGTADPVCRSDLEEVLAHTFFTWEVLAMRMPSGVPTPAEAPLPVDYACGSLPPRLRVGQTAQVIVDSVWVRTEPRRGADTRILLLYQDLPVSLIINAGPVCAEGLTFWNVRYYAGSEYSGWIAEADEQEYYLEATLP